MKKDANRIRNGALRNFNQEIPQPYEEVMPLVIRANVGEKIIVTFSHSLNRALFIHVQGLEYDVQTSDGASVGFNRDSTTRSREDATNVHGLFGAIIVEAAQSRWLNPQTGEELEIKDKNGNQPIDPHTNLPSSTTAISYRSEPMRNRRPLTDEHGDTGEDISMSSWVYGDPAPPILRAYVGDPAKIRHH